ncbi:PDR/VanB family oxidoreductase [Massilia sp. TWR1-2-2]|uniref:PDR/VanB family oxidoreductase n=1 Tax=Massilia sp. TWR1-2-2 TaxID=2804584 RepID=UPI003CF8C0DC
MDMTEATTAIEQARLSLLVRQIRLEAAGINSYELVDPDGGELPPFTAGAHIDVHLPNGLIRQYSLSNSPAERHRYVIAVLRDEKGRGGSKALHESLKVQDVVTFSHPRNNFSLGGRARKVMLLAGGIGVTPLKSMAHALEEAGIEFEFHYCARNAGCVAFGTELAGPWKHGTPNFHYDHGNPADGLDIAGLLREHGEGTHLFYCGPAGFMQACANAAAHWPAGSVHFEHFKAPEIARPASDAAPCSFAVKIASTGQLIDVAPGISIADALNAAGVRIETSCQAGLCGTCKVRYLEGEVDHQDMILGDGEQQQWLTACVSRAKGPLLVLDL